MNDRPAARLRTALAAVVLLALAAGALVLLWPEAEDDERRASAPITGPRGGPAAPHVMLEPTASAGDGAIVDGTSGPGERGPEADLVEVRDDPAADEKASGVGRLTGRVVGPDDVLVPGAVVVAQVRGRRRGEPIRIETDALGRFEAVVPATSYVVKAEASGHVTTAFIRADVPQDGVEDVTVDLRRAQSTLAGSVLGAGGQPLAGAKVFAQGGVRGEAVSGADGAFSIGGLPEGVYGVWARAAGHIESEGQDVAVTEARGGEVTLRLEVGGRVAGTITDPTGAPVPRASLFVYREGDRLEATEADAQGRFDVDGLPPGKVELFTRTGDYAFSARAAVDVIAGALVVRDVALAAGNQITGCVTDAQGAPLEGMHVIARALGGDVARAGRSDADGRFSIAHLYPGRYRVGVARGGPRGPSEQARTLAEVDVTTGPAVCDLVVPVGAVVAGQVLRDDGRPLAKAQVFAILDGDARGAARTDDAGRFRVDALPPGRYRLFVREDDDGLVGQLEQDVAADATIDGLELLARPSARVRGRVVDPTGRPLPDLELTLRGLDAPVERSAHTDADGRFELFPLYDGEYELEAEQAPLLLLARRLDAERATLPGRRLAITQGRDVACDLRVQLD